MAIPLPFLVLLGLFIFRALSPGASGVTDPDYYWHVSYGEWILEHGALPTHDFWSWTFEGSPYRLTQWLGEVSMGLANQLGGLSGTSALAGLLVALTVTASYRAARCYLDNRIAALLIAIACNMILFSLAARPHQFSHLSLAVLSWILASFFTGNKRALYWLPALFLLWVNLHGGYAFGLAYLGLTFMLAAAEAYVTHDKSALRTTLLPLALWSFFGLVATLINPYGWHAWEYVVEVGQLKSSSLGVVDEWAPLNFRTDAGFGFFMITSLVCVAMITSLRRPAMSQLLNVIALMALGWSTVRLSLMVTPLMVPFLAAAFRHTPLYTLAFDGASRIYDQDLRFTRAFVLLAAVIVVSVGLARNDAKLVAEHTASVFPVREAAFIKEHGIDGRFMNTPEAGGYLIRELGAKVSIDSRLDLYGDRALFDMLFALRGEPGWREYVQRMDADVALINNKSPLRHHLEGSGLYRPVFEGPSYTVFVRPDAYPTLPTVTLTPSTKAILDLL